VTARRYRGPLRKQFAQEHQSLWLQCSAPETHARGIAAGTVEAGDKAELYRVSACEEDNWNDRGCRFCRHRRRSVPDDHGHLALHQFSRQTRQPLVLAAGPAVFDRHVLPLNKPCVPQALAEGGYKGRRFACRLPCVDESAPRHGPGVRGGRERPRRRGAAEKRDELASFHPRAHSITSLAAETQSGGSASPRAWAVRRLTTKSNCEVALMGRSPGLAPRRIRST